MSIKIHMNSLGCAKNLVNSEQMLALLRQAGMEVVEDLAQADVAIVNTCGFIDAAKQEAIDTILETAQWKQQGQLKALIATGCLVERYQDEILQELPELDAVCGTGSYTDIVEAVQQALAGQKRAYLASSAQAALEGDRQLITKPYSAFLRIAEGCNNHCSYCIIPSLRGPFRSRTLEHIWQEARQLAAQGAKELLVIAQDTTRYGMDLYGKPMLPELLHRLAQIENLRWIRVLYTYPDWITDELLEVMAEEDKIVKYLDIPLQHCDQKVLREMNRRGDRQSITALIEKIREKVPGIVLRTTLITGFPGETEEQFESLCQFVQDIKFERLGCFAYSAEEGTPAGERADQVEPEVRQRRADIIMELQMGIMEEYNRKLTGTDLEVVVEGYDRYASSYFGRSAADAPDIDGKIFFTSKKKAGSGSVSAGTCRRCAGL